MGRARHTIVPPATDGGRRVRFEKLETLLRVALDMRGNAEGMSLTDIEREYGVSRRTAERMRDAIEAAEELKQRILSRSKSKCPHELLGRIGRMYVGTIHAYSPRP